MVEVASEFLRFGWVRALLSSRLFRISRLVWHLCDLDEDMDFYSEDAISQVLI